MSDIEDDEVLHEIDVYCKLNSDYNLSIYQFPLIPINKKSLQDTLSYINNVGKTIDNNLIFDNKNDLNKQNNTSEEKQINSYINNKNNYESNAYKNSKNSNILLKGKKIYPNTNYFIGSFIDNKLVINSLSYFYQIKPFLNDNTFNLDVNNKNAMYNKSKTKSDNNYFTECNKIATNYKYYSCRSKECISKSKQIINIDVNTINNPNPEKNYINNEKNNSNYIDTNSIINKSLSKQDYDYILYSNLSKETVAEELFNLINNFKPVNELSKLPINDKINYIFSKTEIISFPLLLKICNFGFNDQINNTTISKVSNYNEIKNILKYLSYRARFVNDKILIYKSELLEDLVLNQKIRDLVIYYLSIGTKKNNIIDNSIRILSSKLPLEKYNLSDTYTYFKDKINTFIKKLSNFDKINKVWILKGSDFDLDFNHKSNLLNNETKAIIKNQINLDINYFLLLANTNINPDNLSSLLLSIIKSLYNIKPCYNYNELLSLSYEKTCSNNSFNNTDNLFKQAFEDIVRNYCIVINNKIYIKYIQSHDEEHNLVRLKVLELFSKSSSLNKSEILKVITPQTDLKQLVKTIGGSIKGNIWTLDN